MPNLSKIHARWEVLFGMTEWCSCQCKKKYFGGQTLLQIWILLQCFAQPLYLSVWKVLKFEFWLELLAHINGVLRFLSLRGEMIWVTLACNLIVYKKWAQRAVCLNTVETIGMVSSFRYFHVWHQGKLHAFHSTLVIGSTCNYSLVPWFILITWHLLQTFTCHLTCCMGCAVVSDCAAAPLVSFPLFCVTAGTGTVSSEIRSVRSSVIKKIWYDSWSVASWRKHVNLWLMFVQLSVMLAFSDFSLAFFWTLLWRGVLVGFFFFNVHIDWIKHLIKDSVLNYTVLSIACQTTDLSVLHNC